MGDGVSIDEILMKQSENDENNDAKEPKHSGRYPWHDDVNHPFHYTQGDIECIDAIEASMDPVEFAGFLKGTIMKYTWRFEKKCDPLKDLRKANFYLDKLGKHIETHPDIFDPKNITLEVKIPQPGEASAYTAAKQWASYLSKNPDMELYGISSSATMTEEK